MASPPHNTEYIGRFAPSPTGRLHAGSLLAAVASYLDARTNKGQWLLRIEDLDPPREEAGADQAIIECLKQHGLEWDGEIVWQSERHHLYQQALEQLIINGDAFSCSCSRQELVTTNGKHLGKCEPQGDEIAWRFAVDDSVISFNDRLLGLQASSLKTNEGDFVIQRKDKFFAYQLAVVVDDYLQGVTHIVRGIDLLDSSFKQIALQKALGYQTPSYCHLPILVDKSGQKLSKQSYAPIVDNKNACENLLTTLKQLGQDLPPLSEKNNCAKILRWAESRWDLKKIPRLQNIQANN